MGIQEQTDASELRENPGNAHSLEEVSGLRAQGEHVCRAQVRPRAAPQRTTPEGEEARRAALHGVAGACGPDKGCGGAQEGAREVRAAGPQEQERTFPLERTAKAGEGACAHPENRF